MRASSRSICEIPKSQDDQTYAELLDLTDRIGVDIVLGKENQ